MSRYPVYVVETDAEEKGVAAVIAALPIAACIIDGRGCCVAANEGFLNELCGPAIPPAKLDGQHLAIPEGARIADLGADRGKGWRLVTLSAGGRSRGPAHFLESVIDAFPAMINLKDTRSRYIFMNKYQAELYGIAPENVLGRTAAELLGPDYGHYTETLDRRVVETGEPVPFYEEEYAGVDGVTRSWLTTKVPLLSADSSCHGVATIALDITGRKQLERALMRSKLDAEAADRSKTAFLAGMSHELRTPLNAIIGFSQLLQGIGRPTDDGKIREYAADIESSGQHLLKIINDILEISRIEAGKLELREEEVDVAETIADCLRYVDRRAHEGGIELRWTVCDELPKIRADKTRLKQILLNLLANGVKFTPANGHVRVDASTDRDGNMVIAVSDSGIGMSIAEIDVAMQPFRQVDSRMTRRFEGTGLGLPLTKAFIELHGGRLAIESRPSFGTTARVIFPSERVLTGTTSP